MKHLILCILLLINSQIIWGQSWTAIPGTKIECANIIKPDHSNWNLVDFEYFRKGRKIIGVTRGMSEEFYEMFLDTPFAFDSLYNNAWYKTKLPLDTILNQYDSTLLSLDFDEAVIFTSTRTVLGYKEIIWELKNYSWSLPESSPCSTNVIFKYRGNSRNRFYQLRFLAARHVGCQI